MAEAAGAAAEVREQRAEQLKERVYITFTALAVVMALRADVGHETVGKAAVTLVVAVVGTLLAVFVADYIAHITVHEALPTRPELVHMIVVVLGAAETLVLPLLVIGLSAIGLFSLEVALTVCIVVLAVTLVAVGYLAVFVADYIAHITVHEALPTRPELVHMIVVVLGAAETLVVPLLVIGLSAIGLFSLEVALTVCIVVLAVTLVAVGYLAVRRLKLPIGQRLIVLLAEFVLGGLVILLELAAH